MARINQRGSILEFIIIGSMMALLLVGGAYFVRRTLMSADRSDEIATSQEDTSEDTSDETSEEKGESQPDRNGTVEKDADNKPEDESSQQDTSGDQPSDDKDNAPDNLPQTGPADTLKGGLLVGGLVAVGAAYKRSRDSVTSL